MHQVGYEDFICSFAAINPFQLAHLTEVMLVQFEEMLADLERAEKLPFTQQDIKHVMISTMRMLYIEIAELKMQEAQHQLTHTKHLTFATLVSGK